MTKKLLTSVLCIIMALMLPLCAIAETQRTLTIIPGEELSKEPIIKDLLDVLKLSVLTEKDAGALTITLNDVDVLTIAARANKDGLFLHTTAVHNNPLYFTWASIMEAIQNAMKTSGLEEMMGIDFDDYFDQLKAAMDSEATVESTVPKDDNAIQSKESMLTQVFENDPQMLAWITDVLSRAEISDGEFTDEAHDAATQKMDIVLTNDDFVTMCDTNYMRNIIVQTVAQNGGDVSAEEAIERVKKIFADSDISYTVTVYTANEGDTLVSMKLDMNMNLVVKEDDDTDTANVIMDAVYNRLTGEAGISHKGDMKTLVDNKLVMTATADLVSLPDGSLNGSAGMLADSAELYATYTKTLPNNGADRTLSFYFRDNANALIEPSAADRPFISFRLESRQVNTGALNAILDATVESSVKPLEMTQEEMQSFTMDMTSNLLSVLSGFMTNLPSSVTEALMPLLQSAVQ